jgi:hypothetical protein
MAAGRYGSTETIRCQRDELQTGTGADIHTHTFDDLDCYVLHGAGRPEGRKIFVEKSFTVG